uniref:GCS light chain n=1 Tax=Anas zonorhyncha TaxID=75864 RepID=A0A8B9TZ68_9AVES
MARSALGVAQLDSVIIAPPPTEDGNSLSEYLQPSWQELESLVQNKKIVTIYTSDFDKTLLEQVYVWAQVKPSSNQVNLASCCVMPLDLTALAKQVVIQLLTEIMTQKNYFMKQVSKKFFGTQNSRYAWASGHHRRMSGCTYMLFFATACLELDELPLDIF